MIFRLIFLTILLTFSMSVFGQCPLIPTPTTYIEKEGSFNFESQLTITTGNVNQNNVSFLKDQLKQLYSIEIVEVKKNANLKFIHNEKLPTSYQIDVADEITITYKSDKDAFYAVTSLMQLIQEKESRLSIKKCKITDSPQFQWRGLHLDVARHFFTVDEVKRYIDNMAFYKFNTFHWHLTDDQGWRIEIKKYPKLTEIGAYRDSTIVGHYNANPRIYEKKKYGGFYTQEQIKEVVAYAATKYITVVPEIELPGHARAAIAAYPELSCNETFLPVPGLWGVFDDIFCSKPETVQFLKNVLDEVVPLFPSEYIHIGGDEAPKERWNHCEKCKGIMKENNLADAHELQSNFIQQIDDYLTSKGKKIIGWDEILEGGLSTNAAVMSWRGEEGGIEAASQKHNVVMSPTTYCYFDYYQSGNASEPLAIGGFLPLEKVYNYSIIPTEMSAESREYVLGGQANLWTEYIPTFDQVEYMVYPRALALIQNLWSTNKINYEDFLTIFSSVQEPLLQKMNVNYSRSIYLPELKISRVEDGVEYKFETKRNEELKLTQGIWDVDSFIGVYYRKDVIGNSVIVNRNDSTIQNKFDVQLNSKKLSKEINYDFFNHAALGVQVDLITKPHVKFSNGGDLTLVDGIRGTRPWKGVQWLGFSKDFIEIVIDVSTLDTINSITVGFLDAKGSWIYLPDSILIITEEADGTRESNSPLKITEEYQEIPLYAKVERLRLLIYTKKEIPQGEEGAGNVPWTFIDEIIIK